MTGLVARLEIAGLVLRRTDASDGRATLVEITPAGSSYLRSLHQQRAEVLADYVRQLPRDDQQALVAAAHALAELADQPLASEGV
jgi:DNA-binding MarR family transcriptional regulator